MSGLNPDKCDPEVYEHGSSLGFSTLSKTEANEMCKRLSLETGDRYDWHYVAGRVHMLVLRKEEV